MFFCDSVFFVAYVVSGVLKDDVRSVMSLRSLRLKGKENGCYGKGKSRLSRLFSWGYENVRIKSFWVEEGWTWGGVGMEMGITRCLQEVYNQRVMSL